MLNTGRLGEPETWASSDEEAEVVETVSPAAKGKKGKKGKEKAKPPPDPTRVKAKLARKQRRRYWRAAAEELRVRPFGVRVRDRCGVVTVSKTKELKTC